MKRAQRLGKYGMNVWSEFTPLALKHNAVNLAQGFPDWEAPTFVKQCGEEAVRGNHNQYTRVAGHPRLLETLATMYSAKLQRPIDPFSEIQVTSGATEGLYLVMGSLINPGDEVLLIEPFFDVYPADVELAGGVPVYVPMDPHPSRASGWRLNLERLQAAVTPKTKMLVLNNPMNVPGKVFTREELEEVAEFVKRNDLILISDEVYERLVYDGREHVHIATLPGMYERTITLSSAGKSFSVTGWKVGWAVGPKALIEPLGVLHSFLTFSISTPNQEAVAQALNVADTNGYWQELREAYTKRRDFLYETLQKAGLGPILPEGAFFILTNTANVPNSRFMNPSDPSSRDYQFARWLTKEVGVAGIPPSAFYCDAHADMASQFVRLVFCKKDEVLQEASKRLLAKLN